MYTKSFAAIAALASLASSTPVSVKKGFTVTQTATGNKVQRNGPAAHARAIAKYGGKVPTSVAAAAAQQSGSVTANSEEGDSEYVCDVYIGQNQQRLSLDFDTGSSDLWVFSSEQPSSQTSGHSTYDTSSGKKLSGESWKISYGDQSGASGDVYADKVVIGGVTATSQAVEAATSASTQFVQGQNDGLVGLAFSSINTVSPKQQKTFFDTVKSSLPSQLFTATLKHNTAGSYDFGYIDNSKYSGDLVYTSIDNSQGFWSFTADSLSSSQGQLTDGSVNGIADTGTTLILLDDDVISAYYQNVDGAENNQQYGGYVFPCSSSPPDFIVTVQGQDLTIPGDYINFQPVDQSGETCYGGIQSNSGIGFSIFGDVFLKALFVVFDSEGPQIGFAPQA